MKFLHLIPGGAGEQKSYGLDAVECVAARGNMGR